MRESPAQDRSGCLHGFTIESQHCAPDRICRGQEHFLKMKTRQAATRLLGGHYLRNFRSDLLKTTFSIKPVSGFLNLGSAHNHLAERARFCLCTIKHALCDA
jgi:hypothetical protein